MVRNLENAYIFGSVEISVLLPQGWKHVTGATTDTISRLEKSIEAAASVSFIARRKMRLSFLNGVGSTPDREELRQSFLLYKRSGASCPSSWGVTL